MILIHTADIHLDSPMDFLDKEKRTQRQAELFTSFVNLIKYADNQQAKHILIAGDLFDRIPLKKTAKALLELFEAYPHLHFYLLRGNHDETLDLNFPDNVHTFNENTWTYYDLGEDVVVGGIEELDEHAYDSLYLNPNKTNILLLHGALSTAGADKDTIFATPLKNKNIDYLAMGHYHTYKAYKIDNRGIAAYSGCLEGRGFDECGEKGFVLIKIENHQVENRFIPFSTRKIHSISPDFQVNDSYEEALQKIENALALEEPHPTKADILRINIPATCILNRDALLQDYQKRFFYAEIKESDKEMLKEVEEYEKEISLRGEFVRMVQRANLSDDEREQILRYGLSALRGEEVQ